MREPRVWGVRRSARRVLEGRLPSKTLWGTRASGTPSALDFFGGFAEGQGFGLGEDVGHEHVVMAAERVEGFVEADEVAGDEAGALVDELVEGVLAVGAGLAPVDGAGLGFDGFAVERDVLAVGLHGELLEVGGEALEVLLVGEDGDGLGVEEVGVPDGEEAEEGGEIFLEGRGAEVVVHGVEAFEHGAEVVGADGDHGGEADGGVHGVAAADPVPEAEHVGGVDAELGDGFGVGGDGDEVAGDGFGLLEFGERSTSRAEWALVMVSRVVKVLEATRKRVSSGSRSRVASTKSVPSTLETKRKVRSRWV